MTSTARGRKLERILPTLASAMLHGVAAVALILGWVTAPEVNEPPAIELSLVAPPAVTLDPKPAAPSSPTRASQPHKAVAPPRPSRAVRQSSPVRKAAVVPHTLPLPVANQRSRDFGPALSDSEIAGATTADAGGGAGGGGGGGGDCNMIRMLQAALHKDPVVQAALREMGPRAVMVWNGGWVQAHGEDGAGLAAVREAIMWEVAFAPEACRRQMVHGLVLLSASTGGARLGLGRGEWRWSDVVTRPANR
jgi:hypothetical protein